MGVGQRPLEGVVTMELEFYRGKRVFVTGHTGFKGSWLCRILALAGAEVTGFALPAPTGQNLFELSGLEGKMTSVIGDVRDFDAMKAAFDSANPEIVLHLAAQPLVRESYKDPAYTYETNVMGTVNILECVRRSRVPVMSVVNITTDKVYKNTERRQGYREDEPLDGFDPYSNSKSCSELVTHSYAASFFAEGPTAVSTARAGNVIGGGDFAVDRILPDCVRAAMSDRLIKVRNPRSIRPYQHVLEPLFAYLMIARRQWGNRGLAGWYNVGPEEADCVNTGELTGIFCKKWGEGVFWESRAEENAPHEANYLKLDCSKIRSVFGWRPKWDIEKAVEETVEWTKVWRSGGDIPSEMDREIREYLEA